MHVALVQDFTCETVEGAGRYAEITVNCRVHISESGIKIDAVKQSNIREAIRHAIEDAVIVEAPAKEEEAK